MTDKDKPAFHVSGKMRTSDTSKPPGGAPNRAPHLGLARVSKHAKAKQPPKPKS
jgi:hypothetical protein